MRVLLLRDDITAPGDLEEGLRARGHEVLPQEGPEAAAFVAAVNADPCPVVVVCGASLARTAELCRQVRALPAVGRGHLIATFPQAAQRELQALVEAGADDVLPDPAEPALLDLRLAVAARRRETLRATEEVLRAERAHRESEERFRSLFDGVPVGLYRTTPKGDLLDGNPTLVRLLGYPDLESLLLANSADMYLDPEDRLRWQRAVVAEGRPQTFEARMRRLDGEVIWGRFSVRGVLDEEGQVAFYEGAMEDVTHQKRAEAALRASEERFRSLVQNASDMIAILNESGEVRYASPSHLRVLGLKPEEHLGESVFGFLHPDDRERVAEVFVRLLAHPGEVVTVECRVRHQNGTYRVLESTAANLLAQPAVQGVVLNSHDVTDRKRAEERLRYDALHDELTGLPNRAHFMRRLEEAMARTKSDPEPLTAVLFLDLDRFKIVNDSLGHPVGDDLLVQIAALLAGTLRPSDTISRVGGDEFAILLEGGRDVQDAVQVALRILDRLSAPFHLRGHEVFISASLGIAVCTPDYERPEDLLRDADTAMYRAKASGKARHAVFNRGMHHSVVARLKLETDLRRALDRGELRVHYQPFVSLATDEVVGFEALVRWLHPQRGLLLPEDFLAVAEETGLLVAIGRLVLTEGCRWVQELQERHPGHPPLSLSVNLSHKQFFHPDLFAQVQEALSLSGLDPGRLGLEITEGVILRGAQVTARRLARLKGMGVQLYLDDFGKGYSSLNYLHRFPVDILKIDRSFIARIEEEKSNLAIVEAIVKLAHQLGMRVVAEGVETPSQLAQLRGFDCEYGQGTLFSDPLPGAEARSLLVSKLAGSPPA
ncbi:MAG TPA: EAL domain-containing protein [Thermoanaerobaculia bacterium]|nr:EAL domain-containing protein [Thermoanaerobaculia bacterium]